MILYVFFLTSILSRTFILPVYFVVPFIALRIVVLPEPFDPKIMIKSFFSTANDISCSNGRPFWSFTDTFFIRQITLSGEIGGRRQNRTAV